jgi:hypothetical protein
VSLLLLLENTRKRKVANKAGRQHAQTRIKIKKKECERERDLIRKRNPIKNVILKSERERPNM